MPRYLRRSRMTREEARRSFAWSREQNKALENALAMHPEDWERITAAVLGKTAEEVKQHYELLVEDINNIEAGLVALPSYLSESSGDDVRSNRGRGRHGSRSDQERRKGIAWTEEEHRLFLLGLDKYGKGDWRSISRNFVISRTPTQVASHAQKYFIRLNSMNKEKRRTSIHDITSVGEGDTPTPPAPITGQKNGEPVTSGKSGKQSSHPPAGPTGVGAYGIAIGQPVGAPVANAVGTPANLSIPGAPHTAYAVPGAPLNRPPMTFLMPHAPTQR